MNVFGLYLKQRRKGILAFVLFCIIFAVTFLLYHLPIDAVAYPTLLCTFLGILFIVVDFSRVQRKHKQLLEMRTLTAAMISSFPLVEGIEDEDYQAIIQLLKEEQEHLETDMNNRYTDMIEYYTVWVHQIKTPIASMRLTLQNEDSALSRKLVADLFRVEQYVEMVLAFLRLGSTSTDYLIKEHDLDAIIRGSVKKFAGEFISRKIRLEYEQLVSETIVTDEKWFVFVLEQVISNALKYTQEGNIKIYMKESKTLCIEDTGIGIAPEDLPRIFEKGYTGYNGRSDKRASGIGLYLCKSICAKLGHTITATSVLGQGTTIHINLEQYELQKE
ncbi:sensor histidine kinase [Anaerosporobacter sp.]|uniref:sensor histidine kinase n=1 Tax=Anaerosporobacter sp. TaxID=1872529 RepID=UPI00286F2B0A|nr:sensor histidine kinase [Anaerosporobacter sp.]